MSSREDKLHPMTFDEVIEVIRGERAYQRCRWGFRQPGWPMDEAQHSVSDWLVYMQHYLHIAFEKATTEVGSKAALEALRKVTALGVACCEQHGFPLRQLGTVINVRDGLPA